MPSGVAPIVPFAAQTGAPGALLWRRALWIGSLVALLATALGVFAYPNALQETMPLGTGVAILGLVAWGVVLSGRLRLLILLPLVASYLPSVAVGFVALGVTLCYFVVEYAGRRWSRPLDGLDWALLAVGGWTLLSWVVNLGEESDVWALPVFCLTFLSPWLLVFFARAAPWGREDVWLILGSWLVLGLAQVVPALVKPLVLGVPEAYAQPLEIFDLSGLSILVDVVRGGGDIIMGTMVSAHHLGAVLMLLAVYLVSARFLVASRGWTALLCVVGYVFLMTSAKHVLVAAIPAGVIYLWQVVWPRLQPRARSALVVGGLVAAVVGGSYAATYFERVVVERLWRPAFVLASFNPKAQLYVRTMRRIALSSAATWLGYGPGTYASRAASIRATDVLYKETARLPGIIPSHTAPAYRDVMYDLYTSGIVETVSSRSGVLTNPFSSVVGILGEYGIIGTALLLGFLTTVARAGFRCWRDSELPACWRAIGATAGFGMPFLIGLGFFDSYFEQPDVVTPLIVAVLIALAATDGVRGDAVTA